MAEFIRVKGWGKYQHYKDRNPPWIKLHRELLTSLTWAMADDKSRVLAVACMLLAAATDNKIPNDPAYIRRVAYLNCDPDLSALVKLDFLEVVDDKGNLLVSAITPLASASTMQAHARPETETETEKKNNSSRSRSKVVSVFEKAYEQYPRHVGKRAAEKAWHAAVGRNSGVGSDADEFIYQRVMTFTAVCNRAHREKQFIPHMATWLNQDRYLDDPKEWAVSGQSEEKSAPRAPVTNSAADEELKRQGIKTQ